MTEAETEVPEARGLLPRGLDPVRVLGAVRARRDEMVDALRDLVAMETPSTEPATLERALEWLVGSFGDLGMCTRRRSGRRTAGYLLARPADRGRRPVQLLLGHCDTVWPVGTLAEMPVRVDGAVLHGPGSFDMKGGLVQGLYALRILRDLEVELPLAPVFLVNTDEEIGSFESERTIRRLARIADRAFVLEPSLAPGGRLKTRRKGVGHYEISVRGRAAHAGLNPEEGASAIHELSLLVQRLFELNDPASGVSVNVGTIDGGLRTNVVAPTARATVDVRTPTREDAERIDAALHALRPSRADVTVRVEGSVGRPPLEPSPDGRKLWFAARDLAAGMGLELEEGMAGGGSDGNLTNEFTPTLDGLGAVGDGAHATHEHVDLECMVERTALLALLLALPPVADLPRFPEAGPE